MCKAESQGAGETGARHAHATGGSEASALKQRQAQKVQQQNGSAQTQSQSQSRGQSAGTAQAEATEVAVLANVLGKMLVQITLAGEKSRLNGSQLGAFCSVDLPLLGIEDYMRRIAKYASCSPECYIIALIYLDRVFIRHTECALTPYNIHRLLICAVMIAAKSRDDVYFTNTYYAGIAGLSTAEINLLEVAFMDLIGYEMFVSPETYARFRAELLHRKMH